MALDITVSPAGQIAEEQWLELQDLQWRASKAEFDRPDADIDALVGRDDPDRFVASHLDPNTEVGGRFSYNQLYTHPLVAIARDGAEVVGFAYAANNVSGGGDPDGPQNDSLKAQAVRQTKRLTVVKNHFWVREIAVDPDHQRRGTAKKMARSLLLKVGGFRSTATYFWPELLPFMQPLLEQGGMRKTGEKPVKPFSPASDEEFKLIRMAGRAATLLNWVYRE